MQRVHVLQRNEKEQQKRQQKRKGGDVEMCLNHVTQKSVIRNKWKVTHEVKHET